MDSAGEPVKAESSYGRIHTSYENVVERQQVIQPGKVWKRGAWVFAQDIGSSIPDSREGNCPDGESDGSSDIDGDGASRVQRKDPTRLSSSPPPHEPNPVHHGAQIRSSIYQNA